MKKLFTLLLIIGFCINTNSQYKGTRGSYYQKKDYKMVQLEGYSTAAGVFTTGYVSNRPVMVFTKYDSDVDPYIYITNAHTFDFTYNLSKEDIEDGDTATDNLKVFFIFKSDKKNKKWEVTDWSMLGKIEKYSDKKETNEPYTYAYRSLQFNELTNIDTGEKLDALGIIKKIAKTKEVLITIKDELSDINICRFQGKKMKRWIGRVLSDKYKSIQEELLN